MRRLLADLGLTNTLTQQENIPDFLLPTGSHHLDDLPRKSLVHKFRISVGSELPYYGTRKDRDNIAIQILLACIDDSIKSRYHSHVVEVDRARKVYYATSSVWLDKRVEALAAMTPDAQNDYLAREARETADLLAHVRCDTTSPTWQGANNLLIRSSLREFMNNFSTCPASLSVDSWQRLIESGVRLDIAKNYDLIEPVFALCSKPDMAPMLRQAQRMVDDMTAPSHLSQTERQRPYVELNQSLQQTMKELQDIAKELQRRH